MIFVSGAVSGIKEDNRRAFEIVRRKLRAQRPEEDVVIPHDFVPAGTGWSDAMRMTLARLVQADMMAVVDDGNQGGSRGFALEHLVATALSMPIVRVDPRDEGFPFALEFGDYVVYDPGYRAPEVGRITGTAANGGAFVCYGTGCTASNTPLRYLRPATEDEIAKADPLLGYHRFDLVCPDAQWCASPMRCEAMGGGHA